MTQNDEGEQIVYYRANDERDEAVFVASTIDNIVREKVKNFKDFRCSLPLPMLSLVPLRKPCSSLIFHIQWLVGQNSTAVKRFVDVISYLNLIANTSDNISFERVVNEPKRGVGS